MCSGFGRDWIRPRRWRAAGVLVGWLAVCLQIGHAASCAASVNRTPGPRLVMADWNDVDAALETGAKAAQVAVVGVERSENRIVYLVVTHTDEPGRLIVERIAGQGAGSPAVRLEAHIGRFGDPAREGDFMGHVAKRLMDLHGRDTAPLD